MLHVVFFRFISVPPVSHQLHAVFCYAMTFLDIEFSSSHAPPHATPQAPEFEKESRQLATPPLLLLQLLPMLVLEWGAAAMVLGAENYKAYKILRSHQPLAPHTHRSPSTSEVAVAVAKAVA